MKSLLFTVISLFTIQAYASAYDYRPMVICGNRDLVLDRGQEGRGGLSGQVVLQNEEIISYMVSAGAIQPSEINDKGEFISAGYIYNDYTGFSAGGYMSGMRGVTFTKAGNGYLLKIYVNNYPQYKELANFYFNNCTNY